MLKPYDEYKETELQWIDKIPTHWELERLGNIFTERKTKVSDKEYPPLSVTKKGIVPQLSNAAKSDDGDNRKMVSIDDFVINSRSDRKNSSGVSPLRGSVSLINIVLIPKLNLTGSYTNYLLRSNSFVEEYYRNGRGIVADLWTTRYSEMKIIMLPIPPRAEQDQIVRYLDWQLSKINKLINAKKKQIELLKEQKQAVINKSVTKGLSPNAKMKDSGIAWLGEIPEHWKVNKIKHHFILNPSIQKLLQSYSLEDEVVFLGMERVSVNGDVDNSEFRKIKDVKSGFSNFQKNDVVVAKITPCFENGKGAFLDMLKTDIGYGTTEFVVLRPLLSILGKYLYYITRTSQFRLLGAEVMTGSAGQKRIPTNFISQFTLGISDIIEQQEIIDYIQEKTSTIDKTISVTQKEIELVNEYKASLISEVVTGQVDVRNIIVPNFETEEVLEDVIDEEIIDVEELGGNV